MNTKFKTTVEMNIELKHKKAKTKLRLQKSIREYYDQMNYMRQIYKFQFEEHTFSKGDPAKAFIKHETLSMMKFLQTMPMLRVRI